MQVKLLRSKFVEALGAEGRHLVDVNTIDGFQVSFSCICACYDLLHTTTTCVQSRWASCAV